MLSASEGPHSRSPYPLAVRQALLLTVFSLLCVSNTWHWGLGIVGPTFAEGALRLAAGISPYLPPASTLTDQFQYPPFFAWIYLPLTKLSPVLHGLVWMGINAFVFWLGVSRWQLIRRSDKTNFKWALLFVGLCAFELEGTLRYRQSNALIAGFILLGISDYAEDRNWGAATWLLLGTAVKVTPILFAALLFFPIRRKFLGACLVMGLVVVLAPALSHGTRGVELFFEWIAHMQRVVIPTFGATDMASVATRFGILEKANALLARHVVLISSFAVLVLARVRNRKEFSWDLWIPVALCWLLLCSPKTEQPTFVLFAPVCLFFGRYVRESWKEGNYFPAVGYVLAFFLVSGVHNDIFFPRRIWPQYFKFSVDTKAFGAFVAWAWLMPPLVRRTLRGALVSLRHSVSVRVCRLSRS
jgi:hypothetical protein